MDDRYDDPHAATRRITPPPPPARDQARRPLWPWLILTVAVVFAASAVWYAYDHNLIVKDSGIEACEAMASGDRSLAGQDPQRELTESEYRRLRQVFAGSRHDDIRDHGTKLLDVVWQMTQLGTEDATVLAYLQPLTTHLTGLQSACADQGIFITLRPPSTTSSAPACDDLFPATGPITAPTSTTECAAADDTITTVTTTACTDGRRLFHLTPAGEPSPTSWGFGGDRLHRVADEPLTACPA